MANFNIVTEQRRDDVAGLVYWMAWLEGFELFYSLGSTKDEAIGYLKNAIALRPDLYAA